MPIDRLNLIKPPVLSEDQIAAEQDRFVADVRREIILGGHATPETVGELLVGMRERVTVRPTMTQHDVRYRSEHGGLLTVQATAAAIVEAAQTRAALLAHGPDPEQLLAARLVAIGLPTAEAQARAKWRVQRLEDGRVTAYAIDGSVLHSGPAPDSRREYTAEQLAVFRDPNPAVSAAARAILQESAEHRPIAPAPQANDQLAAVQGAF